MSELTETVEVTTEELDQQIASAKAAADEAAAKLEALNIKRRAGFLAELSAIDDEEKLTVANFTSRRKVIEQKMREAGFQPPAKTTTASGEPILHNSVARAMYAALSGAKNKRMKAHSLNEYIGQPRQTTLTACDAHSHVFSRGSSGNGAWFSLKGHEPANGERIDDTPSVPNDDDSSVF